MWRTVRRIAPILMTLSFLMLWALPVSAAQTTAQQPTCTVPTSKPIHVSVADGERKALNFDSNCRPSVGPDTTPPAVSPSGQKSSSAGTIAPNVAGTLTCHAKSNLTDVKGYVLTESEMYSPWSFDGSNVTWVGGGQTVARWLTDGWHVTSGPFYYPYQYSLPTWQVNAEGWTDFAWIRGSYAHEHRAIQHFDGGGGCYADFYFSGNIPASGSVHYYVFKN